MQCSFCGSPLKEDARYCNQCGTLVASHPFSPKSSSAVRTSDTTDRTSREQIAQQPNRTSRRLQDEPPSWLSFLESGLRGKVPSGGLASERQERPSTANAKNESSPMEIHEFVDDVPQPENPAPEPVQRANTQVRELRVKVWDQKEPAIPTANGLRNEDEFEDLPTGPLVAVSSNGLNQHHTSPPTPGKVAPTRSDEVEFVDTMPLAIPMGEKPMVTPGPVDEPMRQQEEFSGQQLGTSDHSSYQNFSTASPRASEVRQAPPSQSDVPPVQRTRRRENRKPLVIMLVVLLCLVVFGGLGIWIILVQPFSVPGITQPQQSFSNNQLGFSLLYPSGWQSQIDKGKATVHFYDSSHTAQVDIVVGAAPGGDTGTYLQQKANQLGLTGTKNSSTSFGGTSWQQIQGNVLLKGASYTETLVTTTHKNSMYTIMLLAPQTTYEQEDQIVFSKMFASFQFLA